MSDDIFADAIAKQIQEGRPPKPPRDRSKLRAWLVLAFCLLAAGFGLAALVQAIIH